MSTPFKNSVLSDVSALIDEINAGAVKAAAHRKRAEEEAAGSGSASKDPGGYMGKTTHPSGKADGNTQAAPVGARGKENTEDVKRDVPDSVEGAPQNEADSDEDQVQIGTKKSPTGGDPSVEDAYKGDKDDPGTSHPADADKLGEKYSAMKFPALYKLACDRSNALLARLAAGEKVAASKQAAPVQKAAPAAPPARRTAPADQEAAAAGYELAKLAQALGQDPADESVEKFAAAQQVVEGVLTEAFADADAVGEYLYKLAEHTAALQKRAEDPMAGGMPPMPPGAEAGMPAGGDPTGGEVGAAGPEGMGGDAGGGGEAAGGAGGDDAINELANAFVDAGLPVDKLIAALQAAAAGGGGGGGAPTAGGDAGAEVPPEAAMEAKAAVARMPQEVRKDLPQIFKVASQVRDFMAAGRFKLVRPRDAKTAAERDSAGQYLSYLKEVFAI